MHRRDPSRSARDASLGLIWGSVTGEEVPHAPLSTSKSSTTHRPLLRSLSCWTPLFLFTSSSNDLRGSLHLCGLTYRAFWAWALGPHTGSISLSRLFHGSLSSANPRHLSTLCRRTKGGGSPYSDGGRTRYRMTTTPVLLDALASQDWCTKYMLDLSLNGVDHLV